MMRLVIVAGAVVALGVVVAVAWTAPTLIVAAPLWVMALCVLTGYRSASDADRAELDPPPGQLTVLPRALGRLAGHRHRAS